jgi:hypothetical protein
MSQFHTANGQAIANRIAANPLGATIPNTSRKTATQIAESTM